MNDIVTLEKLTEKYPWYSLAHLELYKQMSLRGEEHRKAYLQIVASKIYSRASLYKPVAEVKEEGKSSIAVSDFEFSFELDDEPTSPAMPEKKIVISGGDYFSKNDFMELELDGKDSIDRFIIEKPSISKASADSNSDAKEISGADIFEDINFFTETLAKIYAEQGFYKRAIEVYAKLILLYPEKSTYFASLVQELKNKNNN